MAEKLREDKVALDSGDRLPVFLNPAAGSADQARELLSADDRIELRCLSPEAIKGAVEELVAGGCQRVAVCGGDGTLALAAACLVDTDTELAVLPGGTLNHFAGNQDIPADLADALELALSGRARRVAVGYVNDRLFLNTSSVGAYVLFVRDREQLEKRMSYSSASLTAGFVRLLKFRSAKIVVNGSRIRSPLVFVGINERDMQFPSLGREKSAGTDGLHVVAVKAHSRFDSLRIAAKAFLWGLDPIEQGHEMENLILRELQLDYHFRGRKTTVAVDGELVRLVAPLQYRFVENALRVVAP